jgi:ABC-type glycerol-3-phosphate transport system substrate-binding protein
MINEYVPTLIDRDFNRNILRSPVAFGEYRNVQNAFGVLSLLTIQAGSQLVIENDNKYQILLNQSRDGGQPFETAVTSYTRFASPSDALYSWNRAKRLDRDEFLAETLVFYFGKGSEASLIAARNPNLNFAVAEVPQGATASVRRTYGTFYGLALMKASKNKSGAYQAIQLFNAADNAKRIADSLGMAPLHRSQISLGSNDIYGRISYTSALVARGWLNPRPTETDAIFTQMTEDILANRSRSTASVNDALARLREQY